MDFVLSASSAQDHSRSVGIDEETPSVTFENFGRLDLLYNSVSSLFSQYHQTHRIELLNKAIKRASYAAKFTPTLYHHPRRAEILSAYHSMLHERSILTKDPMAMVDAIKIVNESLDFIPKTDPFAASLVDSMTQIWTRSPFRTTLGERVIVPDNPHQPLDQYASPHSDPRRSDILSAISGMYQYRFQNGGQLSDMEESCEILKKAIKCAPPREPKLVFWLGKLAFMFLEGYEKSGNVAYLYEAIRASEQGMSAVTHGTDNDDLAALLENYADGLQARSRRNGSMEDLAVSIDLTVRAIATTTKLEEKICYQTNLGNRLEDRFDRMNRTEDLNEAVKVTTSALESTTEDELRTATIKHNLGVKLLKLSGVYGQDAYFDQALTLLLQAVKSIPAITQVPALWLNSVTGAFRAQYSQHKREEDLRGAIQYATLALKNTPGYHPEKPYFLVNLAWLLRERAELTRERADLEQAVSISEEAAKALPAGHVMEAEVLWNLGRLYRLQGTFDFGGYFSLVVDNVRWRPPWEESAMEYFRTCLDSQNGEPLVRMAAALSLMEIYRERKEFTLGVEVGKRALDILNMQNTRSLDRNDQERQISKFSDVAVETCSLSLQAGDDPANALEVLEMGRGAILGLMIEDRSDISELSAGYPEHAASFNKLREEVRQPVRVGVEVSSQHELLFRRDRLAQELNQCLRAIRNLPGQERFLRGPTARQLQEYAVDGPIVIVNVADGRSDAILISQSSIRSLELQKLEKGEVTDWIEREPTRYRTKRERGPKNLLCRKFLEWLWTVCVAPILGNLDLLDSTSSSSTKLPRIWWIGAGLAAFLPFHAAGVHSPGSTENTYSKVISSYTPTIKALGYAKERAWFVQKLRTEYPELLIVSMPTTPKVGNQAVANLNVADELRAIHDAVTPKYSAVSLIQPSSKDVLAHLANCDLAHFACHGVSETKDPSNSYLILQQAGKEPNFPPVADKLTVQEISQSVLGRARIAYLSACSTAENRSQQLADEVIHLASGFQVAGFPHVIGALWPSDDGVCVKIAETFYQKIAASHPAEDRDIASALRDAVMNVRARWPLQPLLWAQYIHMGV
jgi:CHAT domain